TRVAVKIRDYDRRVIEIRPRRINPGINRVGHGQIDVTNVNPFRSARAQIETLSYFPGRESRTILELPGVSARNVFGVTVARPPIEHVCRGRDTSPALAGAVGEIDLFNLDRTQRAVKYFDFVDQTVEQQIA